jgi:hypothetical protein
MTDFKLRTAKTPKAPARSMHGYEEAGRQATCCRDEAMHMGLTGAYKCDTNFELFLDCLKEVRR